MSEFWRRRRDKVDRSRRIIGKDKKDRRKEEKDGEEDREAGKKKKEWQEGTNEKRKN